MNSVVDAYCRPGPMPIGVLHHVNSIAGVNPHESTTSYVSRTKRFTVHTYKCDTSAASVPTGNPEISSTLIVGYGNGELAVPTFHFFDGCLTGHGGSARIVPNTEGVLTRRWTGAAIARPFWPSTSNSIFWSLNVFPRMPPGQLGR